MIKAPKCSLRIALIPLETTFKASISKPESISSKIANAGSIIIICKISLRFFSPPEKPSFKYRSAISSGISSTAIFSSIFLINCMTEILSSSGRRALMAARINSALVIPAISLGYCTPKNKPARARSSTAISNTF